MDSLLTYLQKAREAKIAIGHFNISTIETFHAIVGACRETRLPVIIGVSEGEAQFFNIEDVAVLVQRVREKENIPVFLNADHFHDMALIERAARAGFDSILCDFGKLPFDQNCGQTQQATKLARRISRGILIEGELGYLGSGSEIHQSVPAGAQVLEKDFTTPEQAREFQKQAGVDLLSPAVGSFHGMAASANEHISIPHIQALREHTDLFLVLHGGSGLSDQDFTNAIQAGINVIHINTELRVLWRKSAMQAFSEHPDEIAPYKLLESVGAVLQKHISERMRLFAGQK